MFCCPKAESKRRKYQKKSWECQCFQWEVGQKAHSPSLTWKTQQWPHSLCPGCAPWVGLSFTKLWACGVVWKWRIEAMGIWYPRITCTWIQTDYFELFPSYWAVNSRTVPCLPAPAWTQPRARCGRCSQEGRGGAAEPVFPLSLLGCILAP